MAQNWMAADKECSAVRRVQFVEKQCCSIDPFVVGGFDVLHRVAPASVILVRMKGQRSNCYCVSSLIWMLATRLNDFHVTKVYVIANPQSSTAFGTAISCPESMIARLRINLSTWARARVIQAFESSVVSTSVAALGS